MGSSAHPGGAACLGIGLSNFTFILMFGLNPETSIGAVAGIVLIVLSFILIELDRRHFFPLSLGIIISFLVFIAWITLHVGP